MALQLIILKNTFAIYRFNPDVDVPGWISNSAFFSITKSPDELSVVCEQNENNTGAGAVSSDWRAMKIAGPLDLSLVGIIAEISRILKDSNISIFSIATYETDYVLIKSRDLNKAVDSLKANGHIIIHEK
jgi:uncharacterized protein